MRATSHPGVIGVLEELAYCGEAVVPLENVS